MILYLSEYIARLKDYGIHVPAVPDRASRIVKAIESRQALVRCKSQWLMRERRYGFAEADLLRAHTADYVRQILSSDPTTVVENAFELRNPDGSRNRYDPDTAIRSLSELRDNRVQNAAGSYHCCINGISNGFSFYLGGGAHHAHPDFGHGFCIVNDTAIAVRRLQAEKRIETAWIIDVDAHKGDGTAAIFAEDDSVTTLSVHMAHGWPLNGRPIRPDGSPNPSFIPSDIDVPIASGEEPVYVERLAAALDQLAKKDTPDLAVILLGADPYEHDALPSTSPLKLTIEQMAQRDALIYDFLKSKAAPQAYLMAGGYGERAWEPYPPFLEMVLTDRLNL